MTTPNLKTCAVTGQAYEAGDRVVKGQYIVKASVDYTPELRKETEAKLGITAAPAYETPRSRRQASSFTESSAFTEPSSEGESSS